MLSNAFRPVCDAPKHLAKSELAPFTAMHPNVGKNARQNGGFCLSVFDPSQWHVLRVAIFVSTMFEVVIIERGLTHWEWQVCNSDGVEIMRGREKTRAEARYQATELYFACWSAAGNP